MSDRVCGTCGSMWANEFSFCPHDGAPLSVPRGASREARGSANDPGRSAQATTRVSDDVRSQVRALTPRAPLSRAPFGRVVSEEGAGVGPSFADRVFAKEKLHHPAALCETAAYVRPAVSMTSGERDTPMNNAPPAETRRGFHALRSPRDRAR